MRSWYSPTLVVAALLAPLAAQGTEDAECARISGQFKGPSNEHGWALAQAGCRTQARAIYDLTLQITQNEEARRATLFQMGKVTHGWWSTSGCGLDCAWGIEALRQFGQLESDRGRRARAEALEADLQKQSPAAVLAAAPPTEPPAPPPDRRPWWPWVVAGGAGLGLLGGSIPFFVEAGDLTSQAEDAADCTTNPTPAEREVCQTRANDLTARSNDQKLIGGLFAGLGGAALLASAGLLVWWASEPADVRTTAIPLPGGGLVGVDFSF